MSLASIDPPTMTPVFEDVAELLERLGDIPPGRVRLRPTPGEAAEADVLALLEAPHKRLCELIDGVLVEKTMGLRESFLAMWIWRLLDDYLRVRNLGIASGPDGTIRLATGRIRIPDIAYFSKSRLPDGRIPDPPIPAIVPDLTIEILGIGNTAAEMMRKRRDYFGAGVLSAWEVDPRTRTIAVYTDPTTYTTLNESDVLDGGVVLPGFSVAVHVVFAELDRRF